MFLMVFSTWCARQEPDYHRTESGAELDQMGACQRGRGEI